MFAFLGLSIFSFPHKFEISFVIWCIVSTFLIFHIEWLIFKIVTTWFGIIYVTVNSSEATTTEMCFYRKVFVFIRSQCLQFQ